MRIQTMLNYVQKCKSFVYTHVKFLKRRGQPALIVTVESRKNSKPICSGCHSKSSGYDRLATRTFEFVPLWGIPVYLSYRMRRVDCRRCGIKIESVPWAEGKQTMTLAMMQFLATWAKKLSWQETARTFHTSWQKVFSSVMYVVDWGLKHRVLTGVQSIGVDEVAWQKGHRYLTLVYQIDPKSVRLLWIGRHRTVKTLLRFFRFFGKANTTNLKHVCSDMWKA